MDSYPDIHLFFSQRFFRRGVLPEAKEVEKTDDVRAAAVKFEDPQAGKSEVMLYAVGCSMQRVQVKGEVSIKALIDSGAEINVISEALASEARLPMRRDHRLDMIEASGAKSQFIRVCEDVKINIDEARTLVPIFVTKGNEYPLILGRPYERRACLSVKNTPNEICELEVTGDNARWYSSNRSLQKCFQSRWVGNISRENRGLFKRIGGCPVGSICNLLERQHATCAGAMVSTEQTCHANDTKM